MKIALSGRKRSGKDLVADFLIEFIEQEYGVSTVLRCAFGDKLKEFVYQIHPVIDDVKPREIFQFMNGHRKFDKDVWVKHLDQTIKSSGKNHFIITDVRQENELEYTQRTSDFGEKVYTIKIVAPTEIRKQRTIEAGEVWEEEHENHPSETKIDGLQTDFIIENTGTIEELRDSVNQIFKIIKAELS